MRQEWHHFRYPGPEIGRRARDQDEIDALGLDRWRSLPRAQKPPWPDETAVADVANLLGSVPSVVAPYEVDQLRDRLPPPARRPAAPPPGGGRAGARRATTPAHPRPPPAAPPALGPA